MKKDVRLNRFLGLPRDASSEEMADRCEALLAWLESDSIPVKLRPWASRQRALLQEIYESLDLPGESGAAWERSRGVTVSPGWKAGTKAWRRPSFFGLGWLPLTLGGVGVLLAVLVGVLWWMEASRDGGVGPRFSGAEETFHPGEFLESREGRIRELESIVEANQEDSAALFELGETYMVGGDWTKAISWFTRLLEVEPTNVHAHTDIGTASMNLGRYEEAEAAYSQALSIAPDDVQLNYNMGFLFAFRRDSPDLDEAMKHWQEVIRLAPESELAKEAQGRIEQLRSSGLVP